MKIILINFILSTAENGVITRRESNDNTMIYTMARGFMKAGHEVTLLASEEYRPTKTEAPGFEVIYFKSRFRKLFRPDLFPFPKGLKNWLIRHSASYDLAIASETFMMPTLIASLYCRCKLVIWQELEAYQRMMHRIPAKLWYNIIAKIFLNKTGVIARSEKARGFINRFMPRVAPDIVDHGADSDIFFPGEYHSDSFIIISQLIKRKRLDRIIRHFSAFIQKRKYSGFTLDIVGDGPERQNLETFVADLNISGHVKFHGYLYHLEVAPLSRRAMALLIDTERDLNMVTVSESIANGTPVLMNTVPNTASFINENNVGLAVSDWNEHHLEKMVKHYDEFHANCKLTRETLTNEGAARKLIDLAKIF